MLIPNIVLEKNKKDKKKKDKKRKREIKLEEKID